jgi:hypothetical protein
VREHLPSKCEILSSNPVLLKKKKKTEGSQTTLKLIHRKLLNIVERNYEKP